MKRAKKIIAVISVIVFIFFLVFSMSGLIVSVHHDCIGIHCPVCARIAVIQSTVSAVKLLIFALFMCYMAIMCGSAGLRCVRMRICRYFTGITLKTQLNN